MKEFHDEFTLKILALSKELKAMTGIGNKNLTQGLDWDRLKKSLQSAIRNGQSVDKVKVS